MATKGAVLATNESVEVEAPGLTMQQAKRLTERIRNAMEAVGMMLLEAYDKRAHEALGYDTWETYVDVEFQGMSRSQSYKQIDKGRVIKAIADETGITHAKEASQFLTIRAAAVLKTDPVVSAREIKKAVDRGAQWLDAINAAVAKRTPAPESAPVQQSLPAAMPAPVRRGALVDEEALLENAAELRERLKDVPALLRKQLGTFPKRDAETLDDLHDEMRMWVVALSNFTNEATLKSINMLRAELFEWLVSQFRDSREDVGELAGVGDANVDYWRRKLRKLRDASKDE